jgi:hypothetical protein
MDLEKVVKFMIEQEDEESVIGKEELNSSLK